MAAKHVLITGAAGQIGYALCPMVASGRMLGPDTRVVLHLLDIAPAAKALEGVRMELLDAAFPLLEGVIISTDADEACKGVDVAVMVGGFPRKQGMERKDVMGKNVAIYAAQARALEAGANKGVKVLVVANPANTNALMLSEHAPGIPKTDITCLTRLDHNRALAQLAERKGCRVTAVKRVTIWGNHSSTQYPDVTQATVEGKPVSEALLASEDAEWLRGDFVTTVQQRGAAVIALRGLSSAMSAASSACDHVKDWVCGTSARGLDKDDWVSMGVISDGNPYGVPDGLIYSFPVRCAGDGTWEIVGGLEIDAHSRGKMDATASELTEERALALECIRESGAA